MDKLLKIIIGIFSLFVFSVAAVGAVDDTVDISDLPEYLNTDTFSVSYTAYSEGAVSAQFSYRKDTNPTWKDFGGIVNGYSGEVKVTGTQINDGDGLYRFRVTINGGTDTDETTVKIDRTGPSPVTEYRKEFKSPEYNKLFWKNPVEDDFERVFIYRSDEPQFTADGSTKIAERGGSAEQEMTYDDIGLDPNKTYYYALIAFDKAGNPSGTVADPETVTVTSESASTSTDSTGTGGPIIYPEGSAEGDQQGEVLGEDDGEEIDIVPVEDSEAGLFGEGGLTGLLSEYWWVVVVVFVIYIFFRFISRRRSSY